MTEFIVLNESEILALQLNNTVIVHINGKPYSICSDECFKKQLKGDTQDADSN